MRRCSLSIAAIALLGFAGLAIATPAAAGGPTSVLLVDPATQRTASLYFSDPDYDALAALVGADRMGDARPSAGGPRSGAQLGSGITATWLVHDVSVWRIDRINLHAIGGPVISTKTAPDAASIWDSPVVDHRPTDPARLVALLERLGFGAGAGTGAPAGAAGDPLGAGAVSAGHSAADAAEPVAPSRGGSLLWALAGLAVGAALTLTAFRLLPAARRWRTSRRDAPYDAEEAPTPADDLPDDELGWGAPDELSWAGGQAAR